MQLMADLETLGRSSHAPVIEIAVVKFNDEDIVDCFTSHVYPDFDVSKPDVSTLAWWNKQTAQCPLYEGAPGFASVLESLGGWLGAIPIDGVWANAPSFDLVILQNLASAYGMSMPWSYRQYRDMRTFGLLGRALGVPRPEAKEPHVARYDAIAQAEWVIAINKMLKERAGVSIL